MLGISCLAVITHRLLLMLLFGFFHVGTLFPFQFPTLQSLPGVNTFLFFSLLCSFLRCGSVCILTSVRPKQLDSFPLPPSDCRISPTACTASIILAEPISLILLFFDYLVRGSIMDMNTSQCRG